jgi:hypothetical protein
MKHLYLLVVAVGLLGMTGCGDAQKSEAEKVAQAARKSFDTAPPELKAQYQEVNAALESNDLLKANATLDKLMQAQLTPEQQMAVAEQRQNLVLKASAAAQNGDANAAKILQETRSRSRSR